MKVVKERGYSLLEKKIKKTHRGDNSSENEIKSCNQENNETVESVKEKRPYTSKKTTTNPYRRKDGTFSTNPHNVTETRSKGRAKLRDTVVESSTDVNKVSYRGKGTRGRGRGRLRGGISAVGGRASQTVISC